MTVDLFKIVHMRTPSPRWHLVAAYWSTCGARSGCAQSTGMLSCILLLFSFKVLYVLSEVRIDDFPQDIACLSGTNCCCSWNSSQKGTLNLRKIDKSQKVNELFSRRWILVLFTWNKKNIITSVLSVLQFGYLMQRILVSERCSDDIGQLPSGQSTVDALALEIYHSPSFQTLFKETLVSIKRKLKS